MAQMIRKWHDIEQNSPEWFEARVGVITATKAGKIMSDENTDSYDTAVKKLVFERVAKREPEDSEISSAYMERGSEYEPLAIDAYQEENGIDVESGGFCTLGRVTDEIPLFGASPDGKKPKLGGKRGGLEVKCPAWKTMMKYIMNPDLLSKTYNKQVQHQMFVCGFDHIDLFAFHPDFEPVQVTIYPDQVYIHNFLQKVRVAEVEIQNKIKFFDNYIKKGIA